MPRYMSVKYGFLLILLLCFTTLIHYAFIAPMFKYFIIDDQCHMIIHMFSLFIVEPIICIFMIVGFVNKAESKYYDTFI